jgi:hypothetical protein
MEPQGSLPHSQVPVTCPYPEPYRSSPYPHIVVPKYPSHYYPPNYASVYSVVSLPQVSFTIACIHIYSPHTCYMPNLPHSSQFYHPNNIERGLQIIKLFIL